MLPEIQTPQYKLELPISKTTITFRPYLVKEQKILLMALSSDDDTALVDALVQIMKNCLLSDINIDDLPQVDVEYYFYHLRARSQSEVVSTQYRCNNILDNNEKCLFVMEHDFNLLTDLEINNNDNSGIVELTDTLGIKFKYPTFGTNLKETIELTDSGLVDEIIENIDYIFDENNQYRASESTKEELTNFVERLSVEQLAKIDQFFTHLPKIVKKIDITCPKCGFKHNIVVEDIFDFLD